MTKPPFGCYKNAILCAANPLIGPPNRQKRVYTPPFGTVFTNHRAIDLQSTGHGHKRTLGVTLLTLVLPKQVFLINRKKGFLLLYTIFFICMRNK